MRAARALLAGGNVLLGALVLATFGTSVGWARWHHDLAYALLALAAVAAWPLLRRRRLTTLLLASLGAWSTLTGLFLVYVTPGVGHGRWMDWWHGATSVGFTLAFLAHWMRNQPRLGSLARRLAARPPVLLALGGAWTLLALLAFASWRPPLDALFSDRLFLELSSLAFVATAVGLLVVALVATGRAARVRLARPEVRNPLRGAVDLSLLALTWTVALTGFALLYFARDLRLAGAYWPVAAWHVVASALLLGLVATHATFNGRPLRAHLR